MLKRALATTAMAAGLSGCAATAVYDIATAPVKTVRGGVGAAAKTYDLLTTSQSEADEKRGRAIRHGEERLDRLERRYGRHREDCLDGDDHACRDAQDEYDEIMELRPTVPAVRN
jgi:hypothetical protein